VWWAGVAVIAGVVEEFAYRGVLFVLVQRVVGGWWPAVAVCVAAFSLAHFTQGWRGMASIAAIAFAAHGIVRVTGDLYTAMTVHAVYDFFAGVLILRFARRDGVLPLAPAAPAPQG
jgi:CAAX protease family protein